MVLIQTTEEKIRMSKSLTNLVCLLILLLSLASCALRHSYHIGRDFNTAKTLLNKADYTVEIIGAELVKGKSLNANYVRADATFYVPNVLSGAFTEVVSRNKLSFDKSSIKLSVVSISFDEVRGILERYPEINSCIEISIISIETTTNKIQCSGMVRGNTVENGFLVSDSTFRNKLEASYNVAFYKSIYTALDLALNQ